MKKDGWADYPPSFHDLEELGPAVLRLVRVFFSSHTKTMCIFEIAALRSPVYWGRAGGSCASDFLSTWIDDRLDAAQINPAPGVAV